jgi:hypothetical protein
MNERARPEDSAHTSQGSAVTALHEAFLHLVQDTFSPDFCEGASALLTDLDDLLPALPEVIALPEQADGRRHEAAARAAAMRRHPSTRRRF